MDSDFIVQEKPDSLSWEAINQVLKAAHKKNADKGIYMGHPFWPTAKLEELVTKENGKLFVVYHNNLLVGTGAVIFRERNLWFGSGTFAFNCLGAVLPEYAGKGIYKELTLTRERYALAKGIDRIYFDTNEKNARMIEISKKNGFEMVDYSTYPDHNNVIMVKWLKSQPFSHRYCHFMFLKIKYKNLIRKYLYRVFSYCCRPFKGTRDEALSD